MKTIVKKLVIIFCFFVACHFNIKIFAQPTVSFTQDHIWFYYTEFERNGEYFPYNCDSLISSLPLTITNTGDSDLTFLIEQDFEFPFFSFNINSGTIQPNQSLNIIFTFNPGSWRGSYYDHLQILTNDILQPLISFPITFSFSSEISKSEYYLAFDTVLVSHSSVKQIQFHNYSCDTLFFTGYSMNFNPEYFHASFENNLGSYIFYPGEYKSVDFTFSPYSEGYFEGYILYDISNHSEIYDNGGDFWIDCSGFCYSPITTTPEIITATVGCQDSIQVLVKIKNKSSATYTLQPPAIPQVTPPQCSPVVINGTQTAQITSVHLNTINQYSYPSLMTTYTDFFTSNTTTLSPGKDYYLDVYTSAAVNAIIYWLDKNNNGIFETDEKLLGAPDYYHEFNQYSTWGYDITIPTNDIVFNTPLRLRIIADNFTSFDSPCGPVLTGECEDYSVIISPPIVTVSYNGYTFHPGDSLLIPTVFHAGLLNQDAYTGHLSFSFIPDLKIDIPWQLTIEGTNGFIMPDTLLTFDSTFVGVSIYKGLHFNNPGCERYSLNITHPLLFGPQYDTWWCDEFTNIDGRIYFTAPDTGNYTDTLKVDIYEYFPYTFLARKNIILKAYAKPTPKLTTSINSINDSLICVQATNQEFIISNLGTAKLLYHFSVPDGVNWVHAPPGTDSLEPSQQKTISLQFIRDNYDTSGIYRTNLHILSNDPVHPDISLPLTLKIHNPLPDLGPDTSICDGTSYLMDIPGYISYLWNTGNTSESLEITDPALYSVTVVDNRGCVRVDSVQISPRSTPSVNLGNDTTLCENTDFELIPEVINPFNDMEPFEVKVGEGLSFYSGNSSIGPNPFGTWYKDKRTQMLYLSDELHALGIQSGYFSGIAFLIGSVGSPGMNGFNIRIGTTSETILTGFLTGLTQVFSSSYFLPSSGWNSFSFNNSFFWDGNTNIVIEVCFDNNSWSSNSSYEYTDKPDKVWGRFCDNCYPGCELTSQGWGGEYSQRANINLTGYMAALPFNWFGPGNFMNQNLSLRLNNLQSNQSGQYILQVDNTLGCSDRDTIMITVVAKPIVQAGPDTTLLRGDSISLSAMVTNGVSPVNIEWSPTTGLDNALIANPRASPFNSTEYQVTAGRIEGCEGTDNQMITVIPRYPVSGNVRYNNSASTPLPGAKVYLQNEEGMSFDSTYTSSSGSFIFPWVSNGCYRLDASSGSPTGSINATDALIILKRATGMQNLSELRSEAADVNNNQVITSSDALLVMHYTVGNITSFAAGKWTFEKPEFCVEDENEFVNLLGIGTGDVNGSYIPGLKSEPLLGLLHGDALYGKTGDTLQIPVYLSADVMAGAVTLSLHYPENSLELTGVHSSLGGMIYSIRDGNLFLAWASKQVAILPASEPLLVLQMIITQTCGTGSMISFEVGDVSEVANPSSAIIQGLDIILPELITIGKSEETGSYLGQNQPNPFSETTTIPFYVNTEGDILLEILNITGERIAILFEGQVSGGIHKVNFNPKGISSGVYLYRLTYRGEDNKQVYTRRMVICK
ncbi:MAG: GEVED domain-containing protein [Bacteroidetes bacterium]|nr:GEVED domain-containing protein [Bacteroidota bacterium]